MGIDGKLGERGWTYEGIPGCFRASVCHAGAASVGPLATPGSVGHGLCCSSTPSRMGAQGSAEQTPPYLILGFAAFVPLGCSSFASSAVAGDGWQELTFSKKMHFPAGDLLQMLKEKIPE